MADDDPIDGEIILLVSAMASVGTRLPTLVEQGQSELGPRTDELGRRYEAVHESDGRVAFLVEDGFWTETGKRLDFTPKETDAIRRAHAEQLLHLGRRTGREEEFETAMEIREAVVVGV
jgi:hypothetical protein